MIRPVTVVGLCLALVGVACSGTTSSSAGADGADVPTVLATTSIWADVTGQLVCDGSARVESVIPPGADAHSYELSLADRQELDRASLIVANGLGLEVLLADVLDAVEQSGGTIFRVGDHIDGVTNGEDPHVWFDPNLIISALPALTDALVGAGLDEAVVQQCAADYRAELLAVDAEVADTLAGLATDQRSLVTSHDSLGYFAGRYDLEIIGTVIPSPSTLAAVSPRELEELAETMGLIGIPAIFAEANHGADDAQALADRLGDVALVRLPAGVDPNGEPSSYTEFLLANATLIVEALG